MSDEDDITLITVPGWGGSDKRHWQSIWERSYPLSIRAEQADWFYPDAQAWISGLDQAARRAPGRWLLVAHSLGCHVTTLWLQTLSLSEQKRVKGVLLVAPPALPISPECARVNGELAPHETLPSFSGFEHSSDRHLAPPTLLVASRDDPFCPYDAASTMAVLWGCKLIDAGHHGHLGRLAQLGNWPFGQRLLQQLMLA